MSVGVAALDEDHKKLIAIVNDLHDGIASGSGTERLGRVLDGLVSYTGSHFAHEEELFAQTGYPAAAAHMLEHKKMSRLVRDIQARYNKGQFDSLSLETIEFLKNWLHEHILASDKNYQKHLNACGVH